MKGFGKQVPPELRHVQIYFLEKNVALDISNSFYDFYNSKKWRNCAGKLLKNWKSTAWEWYMKNHVLKNTNNGY